MTCNNLKLIKGKRTARLYTIDNFRLNSAFKRFKLKIILMRGLAAI